MGDVDGKTDVGEVEAVAQANQGQADNVMANQLSEILPRLLHSQEKHDSLLGPVGGLEEVVELEHSLVGLVREVLVHAIGVEVPNGCTAHNVHASGSHDTKVKGSVHLLHVASLLSARLEAGPARHGAQDLLHDKLAGEGQDDSVEGHEGNIPETLAVLRDLIRVRGWQLVREEDKVADWVAFGRVYGVERYECHQDGQGQGPGVLDGIVFGAAEEGARLAPLGELLARCHGDIFGILYDKCGQLLFLSPVRPPLLKPGVQEAGGFSYLL